MLVKVVFKYRRPKFAFQTGEVSDKIKRGKHTTRHASLYSLDADSFIMDTLVECY